MALSVEMKYMRLSTCIRLFDRLSALNSGVLQGPAKEVLRDDPGPTGSMESVEEWHIRRVLKRSDTYVEAAETLDTTTKTLLEKRKKYGIK